MAVVALFFSYAVFVHGDIARDTCMGRVIHNIDMVGADVKPGPKPCPDPAQCCEICQQTGRLIIFSPRGVTISPRRG